MTSSGWKALEQWGEDAARIERFAGGVANEVWSVRVHGQLAVGRLGARSDADQHISDEFDWHSPILNFESEPPEIESTSP